MPAPIQDHTCGYFCDSQRHCVEALALPTLTAAEVTRGYQRYVAPYGWCVVAVRPAPEADIPTWQALMGWGGDPHTGVIRAGARVQGAVVGWLVFLEPQTSAPPL